MGVRKTTAPEQLGVRRMGVRKKTDPERLQAIERDKWYPVPVWEQLTGHGKFARKTLERKHGLVVVHTGGRAMVSGASYYACLEKQAAAAAAAAEAAEAGAGQVTLAEAEAGAGR